MDRVQVENSNCLCWSLRALLTLQQETKDVQQEEYTGAIEIREERLVVEHRQSVCGHIADHVGDAHDNQEDRIDQAGHNEERSPAEPKGNKSFIYLPVCVSACVCFEDMVPET